MQMQILDQQTRMWQTACEAFTTEVLQLLQDFAKVTQNLFAREVHKSVEYTRVREKLSRGVPEFRSTLLALQAQFQAPEVQCDSKRARLDSVLPVRSLTPQGPREGCCTDAVKCEVR